MDTNGEIVTTSYTTPLYSNFDPTTGGLEDDDVLFQKKREHLSSKPSVFRGQTSALNFPVNQPLGVLTGF